MSMTDPLGDMLTRIRNAQRAHKPIVAAPASRARANVLEVLKREGYIRGFTREDIRPGVTEFKIELKYVDGEPVIREISRISKPGRRIYSKVTDLPRVYNGLGIAILSTPRGVMSDNEARAANVGGEVLCRVF
jgi:small subunit ribosomal protein S8